MTAQSQKPITLKEAAGIAGVSPDTVARWCKRYGIGRQLHQNAPWRVDPEGLAMVAAGDAVGLERYREAHFVVSDDRMQQKAAFLGLNDTIGVVLGLQSGEKNRV